MGENCKDWSDGTVHFVLVKQIIVRINSLDVTLYM